MKKIAFLSVAAMMSFGLVAHADMDNLNITGDIMMEYFYANDFDLTSAKNTWSEVDFLRMEADLAFQADLDDNITARISLKVDRAFDQTNIGGVNSLAGTVDANGNRSFGIGNLALFLQEAFIKIADIGGKGFSLSAGRQFLNYGDDPLADNFNKWWGPGFIIADSNTNSPLLLTQLGSYRIDPFDAVVLSYETEQARVDLIHARDVEDFYALTENAPRSNDDATLWALYGSYFGIEGHQLDLYVTYNDSNGYEAIPATLTTLADPGVSAGSLGKFRDRRYIVGGRAAGDINEQFAYKAEIAYQFEDPKKVGGVKGQSIEGLGVQGGINYHPDMQYKPNVGFIYTYLGQDGKDGANRTWDGFFAPFNGKTYGLIAEGIMKTQGGFDPLNQFTNMHVFNVNGGLEPMERVAWTLDFYYYLLDKKVNAPCNDPPTNTLANRIAKDKSDGGFEFDTQVDYQFNDNLTTFIGGGVFVPGDVFSKADPKLNDEAYFFRAGMKVKF